MTDPSDPQLVSRCLDGEEAAWGLLVDRYADLVYGIGRRCGLSQAACGDLVQETFLSLVRSLTRLRDHERLVGWIARTARREAWRLTRRRRQAAAREKAAAKSEVATGKLPDEALGWLEDRHLVRRAFGAIGERCRRLLDLLFVSEPRLPYAEIGERLGMPVGSIGPTRQRCLAELESALLDLGYPPPPPGPQSD